MAQQRITTGWRGFSKAKEIPYGTPQVAADFGFNFEGNVSDTKINAAETNADEVNGQTEATQQDILNWTMENSHAQKAAPHNIAFMMGMCLGKVTSSQPDVVNNPSVHQHFFERNPSALAVPSVTMYENDGFETLQYPGVFGKTFKLSADKGGFPKLDWGFGGKGNALASAVAKPAPAIESYLRYGDINFNRGGSLTGTVSAGTLAHGGGPTLFKADLQSVEYSYDAKPEPEYQFGDPSGFVTNVDMGARPEQSLSAKFKMVDAGHKAALIAGTEYVVSIPLVGAIIPGGTGVFNFTAELIFPKVVYKEAAKDRDNENLIVNANFQILSDPVFGSVILKVINEQAAYLI